MHEHVWACLRQCGCDWIREDSWCVSNGKNRSTLERRPGSSTKGLRCRKKMIPRRTLIENSTWCHRTVFRVLTVRGLPIWIFLTKFFVHDRIFLQSICKKSEHTEQKLRLCPDSCYLRSKYFRGEHTNIDIPLNDDNAYFRSRT